ncbi:hypothetical protein [Mesorhizobium mediterraneum]|uniref:hypothetical protein n=1 Tax=Mesorhizobium mediterraneum TaxID=43617 RepID=UPI001785B525|nr:hypothetical protein [Mesorhizobium mediterraneum]
MIRNPRLFLVDPDGAGHEQLQPPITHRFQAALLRSVCRKADRRLLTGCDVSQTGTDAYASDYDADNSLILINLMRANRRAGLWNLSRAVCTTNTRVIRSSRKSSIAWAAGLLRCSSSAWGTASAPGSVQSIELCADRGGIEGPLAATERTKSPCLVAKVERTAVAIICSNILSRLRLVSEKMPCGCSSMIPFASPSSAKAAVQLASS